MSPHASRPIILDPALRARHEGQNYLVLRPDETVREAFQAIQARLRERLDGLPARYPNEAHVTVRGWPRGADRAAIRRVVEQWARMVPAQVIRTEAMHVFGPPTQAIVLRVSKTPGLRSAFAYLSERSDEAGLPYFPHAAHFSADDWIFHISLAYCDALAPADWERVAEDALSIAVPAVTSVVDTAEIVSYVGGVEQVDLIRLTGDP